jgi:hypothetical protein
MTMILEASGRVAGLRSAINRQILLKADLAMKGLPTEPAERSIEILQWSLQVIESLEELAEQDRAALVHADPAFLTGRSAVVRQ